MARTSTHGETVPDDRIRVKVEISAGKYFVGDVVGLPPDVARVWVKTKRASWYSREDRKACEKYLRINVESDPVSVVEANAADVVEIQRPSVEVRGSASSPLSELSAKLAVAYVREAPLADAEALLTQLDAEKRPTVRRAIEHRLATLAAEEEAREVSGG